MKPNLMKNILFTLALSLGLTLTAMSAPYEQGQEIASFKAKDQHEQDFTLNTKETKFLLVSHDMETGKRANAVLTEVGKESMEKQKAVYLANIFGMPGIGRFFAFPKMRKYSHRIILGDDAALIALFPVQQGKVTVLALNDGKISSIKYWNPGTDALDQFLK
jgi:hypothetical protein